MGDPLTSTNDPLFFMHHSGLDRIWAIWQDMDSKNRLWDVSGDASGFPLLARSGLTLDTPIWIGAAGPDRPVRDVMDTINRDGKGFLCYKYDRGAEVYN
jgi:tyrosinase